MVSPAALERPRGRRIRIVNVEVDPVIVVVHIPRYQLELSAVRLASRASLALAAQFTRVHFAAYRATDGIARPSSGHNVPLPLHELSGPQERALLIHAGLALYVTNAGELPPSVLIPDNLHQRHHHLAPALSTTNTLLHQTFCSSFSFSF